MMQCLSASKATRRRQRAVSAWSKGPATEATRLSALHHGVALRVYRTVQQAVRQGCHTRAPVIASLLPISRCRAAARGQRLNESCRRQLPKVADSNNSLTYTVAASVARRASTFTVVRRRHPRASVPKIRLPTNNATVLTCTCVRRATSCVAVFVRLRLAAQMGCLRRRPSTLRGSFCRPDLLGALVSGGAARPEHQHSGACRGDGVEGIASAQSPHTAPCWCCCADIDGHRPVVLYLQLRLASLYSSVATAISAPPLS